MIWASSASIANMFRQENIVPVRELTQRSLQNASQRAICSEYLIQDVYKDEETNNRSLSLERHNHHQMLYNRNPADNSTVHMFPSQELALGLTCEEQHDLNTHRIRHRAQNPFPNDTHFYIVNQVTISTHLRYSHESIFPRSICPRRSHEETRQDPRQFFLSHKEIAEDDFSTPNGLASASLDETPARENTEFPVSQNRGIYISFYDWVLPNRRQRGSIVCQILLKKELQRLREGESIFTYSTNTFTIVYHLVFCESLFYPIFLQTVSKEPQALQLKYLFADLYKNCSNYGPWANGVLSKRSVVWPEDGCDIVL